MEHREIQEYWNTRATNDTSAQSTTNDIYLREIEYRVLSNQIEKHSPEKIADIGCGDGRTTARLATDYPDILFSGFDYSQSMVENATKVNGASKSSNLVFRPLDIIEGLPVSFDLIYTTRCLINLPSWPLQQTAIKNIHKALSPNGIFVMVENFIEGHEKFNQVRRSSGLSEIPIREHNLFFARHLLLGFLKSLFELKEDINISSTYYLVSRVVYSKICHEKGLQPDYFDDHHRLAAFLPFAGEFGPVRMLCLKKR